MNKSRLHRTATEYWTPQDRQEVARAKTFKELAKVGCRVLGRMSRPIIQVCGPITTGGVGTVEGNIRVFQETIENLQKSGKSVFNQLAFEKPLWKIMKEFPRQWGRPNKKDLQLLEEFYGALFHSGQIRELDFIPGWEYSFGACWEYSEGNKLGLEIVLL
ncbi:MAG: hypothetical protein Q8L24_02285 [bacterium]|nr:hypothetical protein [bacterium]